MIGIYKITNKINKKVYIGQSKDIISRWNAHKYYTYNNKTKLQNAFSKYGISNFDFEIIEECLISELDEKEKYWINYYNSYEDGYNMTLGGQEGRILDYDSIINDFYNTKSIHQTAKNLNLSRETIRKILDIYNIKYNKNISIPQEIIMIDPYTLQELKMFPSIKDASNYIKLTESAIRKHLKGETKTCGGYYWKKSGENKNFTKLEKTNKINTKNIPKKILQYSLNKELINEFSSLTQANYFMNKSRSNRTIFNACMNHTQAFGYFWEFKK